MHACCTLTYAVTCMLNARYLYVSLKQIANPPAAACAGNEFYIREWPQLEGRTFAEVLVSFGEAIPLGVRRPDGALMINPLDSYRLQPGADLPPQPPCYLLLMPLPCLRIVLQTQ